MQIELSKQHTQINIERNEKPELELLKAQGVGT